MLLIFEIASQTERRDWGSAVPRPGDLVRLKHYDSPFRVESVTWSDDPSLPAHTDRPLVTIRLERVADTSGSSEE